MAADEKMKRDDIANNVELFPYDGSEKLEVLEGEDIEMKMLWHRKFGKPPPDDADPYLKELFEEDERRMKPRAILRMYMGPKVIFTGETSVHEEGKTEFRVLSKWESVFDPSIEFPLDLILEFEILKQERSWHDIVEDIFEFDFSDRLLEMDKAFHKTLKTPVVPDPPRIKVPCTIHRPFTMNATVNHLGKFHIEIMNTHPTKALTISDLEAHVDPDYLDTLEVATWNWHAFVPPPLIIKPENHIHSLDFTVSAKFKPEELDDAFGVFLEIHFAWHQADFFDLSEQKPILLHRPAMYRPLIPCRMPTALQTPQNIQFELERKEKDPNFFHGVPVVNLDNQNAPIPNQYHFAKTKDITRTRANRNQVASSGTPQSPAPPTLTPTPSAGSSAASHSQQQQRRKF